MFWPEQGQYDLEVWVVMHAQVIDDICKSIQSYEFLWLNYTVKYF
jgi:hypothetical protein